MIRHLELRLQGTPFPYRQADAQVALALKSYLWAVRAGWRTLLPDDAGLVDGEVHRDLFSGPFLGAASSSEAGPGASPSLREERATPVSLTPPVKRRAPSPRTA